MPSKPIETLSSNLNFGGIIHVNSDWEIFVIDNLIYKHLGEYLFNNLKLDTPSTPRYGMLKINSNNEFTLNLQIRFK